MRAEPHAHRAVHPDRFASRICREFLYAVCERLAARGAVRLFALKIGAKIVAMRIGFVVGDSSVFVLLGVRPALGALQRHDHDGRRSDQVRDRHAACKTVNLSPGRDDLEDALGPAPNRLRLRLRSQRSPAVALGEQRLSYGPIGNGMSIASCCSGSSRRAAAGIDAQLAARAARAAARAPRNRTAPDRRAARRRRCRCWRISIRCGRESSASQSRSMLFTATR